MTKYFLVNKNFGLISGCDYGSVEAAKAAIKTSNIPEKDAEVVTFDMNYLYGCYSHNKDKIESKDN